MIIQALDILGCTCGIIGAILCGRLNRIGYIFFMGCNTAYMLLGYMQGNYGLMIVSIFLMYIDIHYFIKWKYLTKDK